MACCVFTAFFMSKIITACELFDVRLLDIKYNDADSEAAYPATNSSYPYHSKSSNSVPTTDPARPGQRPPTDGPIQTTRLCVTGMTCAACVATLTKELTSRKGVIRTSISLPLSRATIVFDSTQTSIEDLVSSIEDVGFGAEVFGHDGHSTATQNMRVLQREDELRELRQSFNGAAKWATTITIVDWLHRCIPSNSELGTTLISLLHLITLVIACYLQTRYAKWIHRNAWATCFNKTRLRLPTLSMDTLLSLSLLLSIALSFFNITLHGLSPQHAKTYFSSASFLTVVVSGGRYLDVTLKRQGTAGFSRLFGMQREMELGMVMVEGSWNRAQDSKIAENRASELGLTPLPTTLLAPLDTYHVPAQSLIPCDSYVVRGLTIVDESSMTGESVPVRKTVGDFLTSGTRNLSNGVVAVVLKAQSDSSLEKLVESIEQATEIKYEAKKSTSPNPWETRGMLLDLMTAYFVPAVLMISSIGFLCSFYASPTIFPVSDRINVACERAMAILAAACPCAIGLANPSAIMAGIDASYVHGVLLPGGAEALENISKLTHLVLDKTGTLTEGKLQISEESLTEPFHTDPRRRELMYNLLCAAERDEAQTHPVARAVFQYCLRQLQPDGLSAEDHPSDGYEHGTAPIREAMNIPGKGVACEVQAFNKLWYTVHIGSERFLFDNNIKLPSNLANDIDQNSSPSTQSVDTTSVYFAIGKVYVGTFTLRDAIRKSAPAVIQELKSNGIELTMLTGDTAAEAYRVSKMLGIPVLAAKSLPEEKRQLVEGLKSSMPSQPKQHSSLEKLAPTTPPRSIVAMLGDGLNDAPAQSVSDVGILFGLSPLTRSSRAIHTSATDVILLTPDLSALPKLLDIAKQSVAQAMWNIKWAVAYNIAAISVAMGAGEALLELIGLESSMAKIDAYVLPFLPS
ncbi:hypothetical protein B0A52_10078 [Exophiala mesophila]|uniref:HMA domain-containing protein n=1 Tax=Exophiala mesophila TaxID=212818 RepID=A0A438MRD2_EXOME|nr:hypothetical protein B0A52_10078 [Exophiala mesophila]